MGGLLINKYVKKLDFVKMSGSFASLHNPLVGVCMFSSPTLLPLFTTTILAGCMTSHKKSPFLTPTGPLF